jgi:hypothetical protein
MKIRVTEKDIALGERRNFKRCPIARAATRQLKHYCSAHRSTLRQWTSQGEHIHFLTRSAKRFIKQYDANKPVKPFNFILRDAMYILPRGKKP